MGEIEKGKQFIMDDSSAFESWRETYFEVVANIVELRDRHDGLRKIQLNHGRTGFWGLAKEMTDKFEKKNKDTDWDSGDYDFYDMVDEFCISYFDTL